ncbi:uncharacterized protein LOC129732641 [Wyeomyia smithii]|uniref:uncharacterized protein LOC129732641 n=1 Tax=Wyeomyia smithii TaxID=174621 RepID=UPI002467D6DC|nr:uncharacterized protein LOC129732641 [Wyeomyia smithii]XP_055549665.1 uncharacterized protein LOC129732641 [Wyeomyia smithii]
MFTRAVLIATKTFASPRTITTSSKVHIASNITCIRSKDVQTSISSTANNTPADSYLSLLKSASDAKEVLEFLPTLSKRDNLRQIVTLPALKSLFELHKLGKTSLPKNEVLGHSRFAELCRALKYESRSFGMNDITECLKILTYFGVHSNSEIMTILLNLLRYQINEVTLDHILFLDFVLKKMDQSPLIEALQLALPMLLQIQLPYKMDHNNVQQLVDLLGFVAGHKVSSRTMINIISALTLHGTNINSQHAAEILITMCELGYYELIHTKLLENIFIVLEKDLYQLSFKTIDFILMKISEKNLEKYPMFYNEAFIKKCSQFMVDKDVGILNALYFQKKLNKIAFLHVPLLDYIASKVDNFSIVPYAGIITIVAAFANANYRPPNWNQIQAEIMQHSTISNPSIPWIRYNLELLSLEIFNDVLLRQYLEPRALEKSMARDTLVDHLQLLELSQALQLLYPEYEGPLPDQKYLEKATVLLLEDNELPLQKTLETVFGGSKSVLSHVTSNYGHVLHHVIVFNQHGLIVEQPDCSKKELTRIENLLTEGNQPVAIMCLPKSFYAHNVNRLRGRFAMNIRTIETLGVPVVPVSYQMWKNLPEAERLQYLEREIRSKLV